METVLRRIRRPCSLRKWWRNSSGDWKGSGILVLQRLRELGFAVKSILYLRGLKALRIQFRYSSHHGYGCFQQSNFSMTNRYHLRLLHTRLYTYHCVEVHIITFYVMLLYDRIEEIPLRLVASTPSRYSSALISGSLLRPVIGLTASRTQVLVSIHTCTTSSDPWNAEVKIVEENIYVVTRAAHNRKV